MVGKIKRNYHLKEHNSVLKRLCPLASSLCHSETDVRSHHPQDFVSVSQVNCQGLQALWRWELQEGLLLQIGLGRLQAFQVLS